MLGNKLTKGMCKMHYPNSCLSFTMTVLSFLTIPAERVYLALLFHFTACPSPHTAHMHTYIHTHTHLCTHTHPIESKMMGLLVPLFVSSLADLSSTVSRQQRAIHDHILQRLIQIGPKYPTAFKLTMQGQPAMKQRLEGAIRASQTPTKGAGVARGPARGTGLRAQPSAPSIKLKMDFSNFK